jgi:hypothetical protein
VHASLAGLERRVRVMILHSRPPVDDRIHSLPFLNVVVKQARPGGIVYRALFPIPIPSGVAVVEVDYWGLHDADLFRKAVRRQTGMGFDWPPSKEDLGMYLGPYYRPPRRFRKLRLCLRGIWRREVERALAAGPRCERRYRELGWEFFEPPFLVEWAKERDRRLRAEWKERNRRLAENGGSE